MSDTQYTPGPWVVADDGDGLIYVLTEDEGLVADAHDPSFIDDEVAKANARLIAAAPELVEALEKMTAHYVALVECGDCGFWDANKEPEVIAARAALSKARGEA